MNKNGGKLGFNLSNKEKLMFVGGALYSTLLIILSYKAGCELSCYQIDRGLKCVFGLDSEIEPRIRKALTKLTEK